MRRLALVPVLLALAAGSRPLAAQTSAEQEVRQVVDRLFNGMRAGDSTAVRASRPLPSAKVSP